MIYLMNMKKIIIGVTQFGMHCSVTNNLITIKEKIKSNFNFSKKKYKRHYILQNTMVIRTSFLVLSLSDFEIFLKFKSEDLLNDKFFKLNEIKSTLKK